MKNVIGLLMLSASLSAGAMECVDDNGNDMISSPETFQKEIAAKKYCYQAVELAEACAWGSSMDVSTTGIAYETCAKEMDAQKPKPNDYTLLQTMEGRCDDKYANEEGTLALAMNAYCHLSAIEWMVNVTAAPFFVDGEE